MPEVTAAQAVEATAIPLVEFGRGWMTDPATVVRAAELGLPSDNPFGFWVSGRAGVLGDGLAAKAAAAIGFMAPKAVAQYWDARPAELSGEVAAQEYARTAAAWGRPRLEHMSPGELSELVTLSTQVSSTANPSVGSLFAGWRTVALPDDPAGAATVAMNVLRELRGGAHLSAVHAAGIGPLGAIISVDDPVRGGAAGAERFGWTGPFPEPDYAARLDAEKVTSKILEPIFDAALDPAERARIVQLVQMARTGMDL